MKRNLNPFVAVAVIGDGFFIAHGAVVMAMDGDPTPDLFALAAVMLAGWIAKRRETRR